MSLEWWIGTIVPIAMLIWLLWMSIKGEHGCILFAFATASEISSKIAEVIRNIILQLFDIASPILTMLGVAEILLGLFLWFGARQEFLGWRLLTAGIITLIFVYIVVPLLLSFI